MATQPFTGARAGPATVVCTLCGAKIAVSMPNDIRAAFYRSCIGRRQVLIRQRGTIIHHCTQEALGHYRS